MKWMGKWSIFFALLFKNYNIILKNNNLFYVIKNIVLKLHTFLLFWNIFHIICLFIFHSLYHSSKQRERNSLSSCFYPSKWHNFSILLLLYFYYCSVFLSSLFHSTSKQRIRVAEFSNDIIQDKISVPLRLPPTYLSLKWHLIDLTLLLNTITIQTHAWYYYPLEILPCWLCWKFVSKSWIPSSYLFIYRSNIFLLTKITVLTNFPYSIRQPVSLLSMLTVLFIQFSNATKQYTLIRWSY